MDYLKHVVVEKVELVLWVYDVDLDCSEPVGADGSAELTTTGKDLHEELLSVFEQKSWTELESLRHFVLSSSRVRLHFRVVFVASRS